MFRFLCVILGFTIFIGFAKAQDGTPCNTPNKEPGLCISVYSCKSVLDILSRTGITQETRNYLRSLSCGYNVNSPLVCCAQSSTTRNTDVLVNANNVGSEEVVNESGKLLSPPQCGESSISLSKVVGGIPAKPGEFPWVVALGYRNTKNPSQPRWLCGGTLITDRHVITAAHCVHNQKLYVARVGELDLYDDNDGASPVDIPIASSKIHEEYSSTRFTTDIAIITLSASTRNIPGVIPICLPWQNDLRAKNYVNYKPFVAGWGSIYFNGPSSSNLQIASIPVVPNSDCERAYANKSIVDERILCAGFKDGSRDSCKGDSGGPLMTGSPRSAKTRGVTFYLIGIVSYGFRCAEPGYPGVYTRVTHFLNWIEKNI